MKVNRKLLVFYVLSVVFHGLRASSDVCTNTIIPGSKGETGEPGDIGEPGRQGKTGAPGQTGVPGETGFKGAGGHTGKTGPTGQKGDSGDPGLDGPLGLKGKPGSTCDCGRYRKVVGQMDINVAKLTNAVRFLKNVILGFRETDDSYFLLVKEARSYREAVIGCKLRGGTLAMPKTNETNSVMADYVQKAGLTKVHIGLQRSGEGTDGGGSYVYSDASPLLRFSAWGQEEGPSPSVAPPVNSSCVELHSTGTWGHTGCDISMFYICQYPKNRRGGRGEAVTPVVAVS